MTTETMRGGIVSHFRRMRDVGIVALACVIACSALSARAGNIFDDDWIPPKSAVQPHGAAAQPPPAVPNPPAPATNPAAAPSPNPQPQPTPAPQPPARRPIPGKLEQARSRGLLKEAFAGQLKDRSVAGRKKLAQALLDEVPKTADNPSDEYVLLGGAIDASNDAGALDLCFQAADTMASQYEVDGLSIKTDAALKINLRGDSPATAANNVQAALALIDPLLAAEDFSTAAKILTTARHAASSDPALAWAVQQQLQIAQSLRAAKDRVAASVEKLKTSPEDPAANLAVGSYLCFSRGEWEKGLVLLTRGSDAALKQLATLELSRPINADDMIRLADGWWELAAKRPNLIRPAIRQHAAIFYKLALESETGLRKTLLERRIADAAADMRPALAAARTPGESWVVLFRSSDPNIWGKAVDRGKDDLALELTAAPEETKWLRLTCAANRKSVIIPMTKEAISRRSLISKEIGWEGTALFALGASHLGIWSERMTLDHRGVVAVGSNGHDRRGWGFGRHHQVDKDQAYTWEGEELKGPVVFEIAVKGAALTDSEQKVLLVVPSVAPAIIGDR